jgi:hypothetical protein
MFNEIFGRGSLKDYCPISIVKEEADWKYTSGVLAQEVYSLYVNNALELNKNTMLIHCIWIQYTIPVEQGQYFHADDLFILRKLVSA